MAQNGNTVAGRKVELIVKDDTGVPDTTRRIAQELVVNDKVDVLAGFGITPLGPGDRADRDAEQDADGRDGGGHVGDHRRLALHRAHQLHAAAGDGADGRLGAQERHQEGRHPGHRLRPGHRRREVLQEPVPAQRRPGASDELRTPLRSPDFAPFLQKVRDAKPDALFVLPALGAGRGVHEAVRRARPRQGGHQADRHRRRHRRRPAQRHGRRRARRRQLAPLLGGAPVADQQEVRRRRSRRPTSSAPTSWPSAATTACA